MKVLFSDNIGCYRTEKVLRSYASPHPVRESEIGQTPLKEDCIDENVVDGRQQQKKHHVQKKLTKNIQFETKYIKAKR